MRRWSGVAAVAAAVVLLALPWGVREYNIQLANLFLIGALFALSFNVLFGYTGLLSFGQATFFTATISAGTNVSYLWNFGDGSTAAGQTTSHTYASAGNFTALVTATNSVPSSASATSAVTITKASPVLAITGDGPDPSVVGQSVGITFTVTPPGAGTPTGVVTITDGTQSCTANLPTNTCNIAFTSADAKTLTAQYSGNTNFNAATSTGVAHTVNKASTTTSISAIVPTPAFFGQPTAITATLTVNAPGAGTPTGRQGT